MIPDSDIFAYYTIKNPYPIANRMATFIKKFRKIEAFIREYDKNHV